MIRLISEEEIKIASIENANNMYGRKNGEHQYFNASVSDFNAGVSFAEEKLKYLAIEYGLWIDNNYWSKHSIGGWYNTTSYSLMNNPLSSEQLFEKFLSETK